MSTNLKIALIAAVLVLVFICGLGISTALSLRFMVQQTTAMEPTIVQGSPMIFRNEDGRPQPSIGDIYAYIPPLAEWGAGGPPLVGRIAGLPGDTIIINDGKFGRNDDVIDYPFPPRYDLATLESSIIINHRFRVKGNVPSPDAWNAQDRIPPDCYLVLADNVDGVSEDSSQFGFVPGTKDGPCASPLNRESRLMWKLIRAGRSMAPSRPPEH